MQSGEGLGEELDISVVPKRTITVVAEPKIDGASAAVRWGLTDDACHVVLHVPNRFLLT
jgi:hypothetical protein